MKWKLISLIWIEHCGEGGHYSDSRLVITFYSSISPLLASVKVVGRQIPAVLVCLRNWLYNYNIYIFLYIHPCFEQSTPCKLNWKLNSTNSILPTVHWLRSSLSIFASFALFKWLSTLHARLLLATRRWWLELLPQSCSKSPGPFRTMKNKLCRAFQVQKSSIEFICESYQLINSLAKWPRSRKLLQTCRDPAAP